MALKFKANSGATEYKLVPAGSHVAICYIVADLGLQPGSALFPNPKHEVRLEFEIPEERIDDKPMSIGQTFTASMNEKANLRKQLESWRGLAFTDEKAEEFDVASVLGVPCMLSVVHNTKADKTYANIKSISGLPKGFPKPKGENPQVLYDGNDTTAFSKLPEWLQKKIEGQIRVKQAPETADTSEYPDYNGQFGDQGITDEDIPF